MKLGNDAILYHTPMNLLKSISLTNGRSSLIDDPGKFVMMASRALAAKMSAKVTISFRIVMNFMLIIWLFSDQKIAFIRR